jgi:hypothetical protein
MLFARAISNGVKWFTPDVFSGPVYVPEEMESVITEEAQAVVIDTAEAITAARESTSIEELQSVWSANTALHGNAEFKAVVSECKSLLTAK